MTEDSDKFSGVSGGVPGGKCFGIDWCERMDFVRTTVRDAVGGVSDGSDEGDEKSGEGCFGVIPEAQTTTLEWEVGEKKGKLRERGVRVGNSLEEQVVCGLEGVREGRGPGVEGGVRASVAVVENIGCKEVSNRGESAVFE